MEVLKVPSHIDRKNGNIMQCSITSFPSLTLHKSKDKLLSIINIQLDPNPMNLIGVYMYVSWQHRPIEHSTSYAVTHLVIALSYVLLHADSIISTVDRIVCVLSPADSIACVCYLLLIALLVCAIYC